MDIFAVTHESYCHPSYVLYDDNISIFGCDKEHVLFSYTPSEVKDASLQKLLS